MKRLSGLLLAILLTVPVFLILTRVDAIPGWLFSDRTYTALSPLFRMFGAVGVEGHEDVITGVLLVLSFIVACAVVWIVRRVCNGARVAR